MRTVLVTGGSSAIGRAVARELAGDHRLVLLRHRRPVPLIGEGSEELRGGLAAVDRHRDRIRAADVVLHMAAVTHADAESDYLEVNLRGTEALLEAGRDDQPFVFVSTRCVGPEGGAYSRSKGLAEGAVRASGRPFAIVRPAEVYGSESGEGIDALVRLATKARVLPDLRWRPEITYSPISVEELAGVLARLVRSGRLTDRVYTVANWRSYSARDIQQALEKGLGKRIHRLPIPVRALMIASKLPLPLPFRRDQIPRLVMEKAPGDDRIREELGFEPRCFLEWLESGAGG